MADLKDFKSFADDLLPIVEKLFAKAKAGADATERDEVLATIEKLKKLVGEAKTVTPASVEERAAAIVAERAVLTSILEQAASSSVGLDEAAVRQIQADRNALRNAFGLLLEKAAFEPIVRLLDDAEIAKITTNLRAAEKDIRQRRKAKKVLDAVIQVATIAAQIAVKFAA